MADSTKTADLEHAATGAKKRAVRRTAEPRPETKPGPKAEARPRAAKAAIAVEADQPPAAARPKTPRRAAAPGPRKPAAKAAKGLSGQALADLVAASALEHKLIDPVLLNLAGLSPVADWFFIGSAQNSRQVTAVAEKIVRRAREAGVKPLGVEGLAGESRWALIDLGDVVAHIFNLETRSVYDLEGLWADAPRRPAPEGRSTA